MRKNISAEYLVSDIQANADWWIENVAQTTARQGCSSNWAIRRTSDSYLIGGIGFHDFQIGTDHKAEIGYWLAKPYWCKGIMTLAVEAALEFGFREFGLTRITATVFSFNQASSKVLEKTGFLLEAPQLRNYYKKDGKIFDGKLYAKVRSLQ